MAKPTREHTQVDKKSICSYTMGNQISIAKASENILVRHIKKQNEKKQKPKTPEFFQSHRFPKQG